MHEDEGKGRARCARMRVMTTTLLHEGNNIIVVVVVVVVLSEVQG